MGYQSNRASDKPSNGLDSSRGIGSSLTETDALANGLASGQAAGAHLQEAVHDPRWMWAAVVFLLISTLIRLAQLNVLELAPDEAYYWDWSRRLALGYYDQGPMVAYVIRLTTTVFGTNEFGVRFGILAASCATMICAYLLAQRLFSPLAGFLTVVLLGTTPLIEVGSIIATYDPLMVCFWALSLVMLERALFAPTLRLQRWYWLGAGIACGLGFLSKHTMLLILPCLVLFLLLSPAHRKWLRRPEPYAAFAVTLLLYSGVFWWNSQHHWWTFGHLLFLAKKDFGSPLRRFGDFIGSQALLLGPALFLACLWAGWQTRHSLGFKRSAHRSDNRIDSRIDSRIDPQNTAEIADYDKLGTHFLFLFCMGFPVLAFFCLMTLKAKVQGNWAPCAWIAPTILWAGWATTRPETFGKDATTETANRGLRRILRTTGTIALLGIALTMLMISPGLRHTIGLRLPPAADVSNTAYGWRNLAAHVQQTRQEMETRAGGRKVFVAGNGYQYAALMAFYLPDRPRTYDLFLHYRLTMYAAYVEELKPHLGEDCVFINDGEADDRDLRIIFERVEWEPPFPIWRRPYYDKPVRYLHIARCYGYRRYVGLDWASGG